MAFQALKIRTRGHSDRTHTWTNEVSTRQDLIVTAINHSLATTVALSSPSLEIHILNSSIPIMADNTSGGPELIIGTRNSRLALVQAERVSNALCSAHPQIKFPWQIISVSGDVDKTSPFLKFGGPSDAAKNIWTEEMEAKLCAGELDLLVHCLKDMPTQLPSECALGAIIHREDPTDALVVKESLRDQYTDLDQLPAGSVIGTSSTRRKALLRYKYPHLKVQECRGNM